MDRSFRQRIKKEGADVNTVDQMNLIDIYRTFSPIVVVNSTKHLGNN